MTKQTADKKLTFAFCTYNRAERLPALIQSMRAQRCPIPFEILVVNNNSQDNTLAILQEFAGLPGPPLRFVTEPVQGIVPARNRVLEEAMGSDILVFIDDDETPLPGLLAAATHAILEEGAQCVGGQVHVDFSTHSRPSWLVDELLGFLAETNYGEEPFWISNSSTPIWTANVAYDLNVFRTNATLRFDQRYDRKGKALGGGEDVMMFYALLALNARIRYRPDMIVLHAVEPWRLNRRYFLKIHFVSGYRTGLYQLPQYNRTFLGVPPFLFMQAIQQVFRWFKQFLAFNTSTVRQGMNVTYALGLITGCFTRWKTKAVR